MVLKSRLVIAGLVAVIKLPILAPTSLVEARLIIGQHLEEGRITEAIATAETKVDAVIKDKVHRLESIGDKVVTLDKHETFMHFLRTRGLFVPSVLKKYFAEVRRVLKNPKSLDGKFKGFETTTINLSKEQYVQDGRRAGKDMPPYKLTPFAEQQVKVNLKKSREEGKTDLSDGTEELKQIPIMMKEEKIQFSSALQAAIDAEIKAPASPKSSPKLSGISSPKSAPGTPSGRTTGSLTPEGAALPADGASTSGGGGDGDAPAAKSPLKSSLKRTDNVDDVKSSC